ncbi:MAG: dephospho-CoA kinase [Pseudomonadota bacterium]
MIIGVTGGIGSGKSAATRRFQEHGITVVDADLVSRQVVQPGTRALDAIVAHFGEQVMEDDGSLDRAALREIVFHDPAEKHWLEALLHPLIRDAIVTALQASEGPYTILSSPLLLESGQDQLVDRVLVIDVPEALQLERTLNRDGGSEDTVRAIMDAQLSRRRRLARATDIIVNDGDLTQLHRAVDQQHEHYQRLAALRDGRAGGGQEP